MAAERAISLSVNATSAFNAIGRVERELRKLTGKPGQAASSVSRGKREQGRLTAPIRRKLANAIALAIELTGKEIDRDTPVYSGWLASNWKLAQGSAPNLSVLPTPAERKTPGSFAFRPLVLADEIDGTKRQWLYNNVAYAADAAAGNNPYSKTKRIKTGGGPDWFLNIGQRFSSGVIFKTALSTVVKGGA